MTDSEQKKYLGELRAWNSVADRILEEKDKALAQRRVLFRIKEITESAKAKGWDKVIRILVWLLLTPLAIYLLIKTGIWAYRGFRPRVSGDGA